MRRWRGKANRGVRERNFTRNRAGKYFNKKSKENTKRESVDIKWCNKVEN